jgi:hypothetical protein
MKESVFFSILSAIGIAITFLLYPPIPSLFYICLITIIALLGENIVSGKGFYTYKRTKPSWRNIPIYIVPFWISIVTLMNAGSTILVSFIGLDYLKSVFLTAFFTGGSCFLLDLLVIEPIMCRRMSYWQWHNKRTILSKINRKNGFTAPLGNYIIWFFFPFLTSAAFLLF